MLIGDLSVLDQLKALRAQIETLDGRLRVMEEKRGQVADQVYVRVRADYSGQREQLSAQAAPLKIKARELYAQLQVHLAKLDEAFEEHRLATEELELRHTLGEFDDESFSTRKQAIAEQLGSKRSEREQALELRGRFVDAFGDERELAALPVKSAPTPAVSAAEATVVFAPVPAPPQDHQTGQMPAMADSATTILQPISASTPTVPVTPVLAPAPIQVPPLPTPAPIAVPPLPAATVPAAATIVAPPIPGPAAPPVPTAPTQPVSAGPAKRGNPDGTLVFRPGRLLPLNAEAGMAPTTLSLKPIVIGSDNSCDIRLSHSGIGRRHIEITMSRAGFVLKDVAGGNLVTVNGEAVSERILEDGDSIGLGAALFQFKRG